VSLLLAMNCVELTDAVESICFSLWWSHATLCVNNTIVLVHNTLLAYMSHASCKHSQLAAARGSLVKPGSSDDHHWCR